MNMEEFMSEAVASKACPPNFKKVYNKFRIYQNEALNTLKEFHRVCEKNHIPYQLCCNGLLRFCLFLILTLLNFYVNNCLNCQ